MTSELSSDRSVNRLTGILAGAVLPVMGSSKLIGTPVFRNEDIVPTAHPRPGPRGALDRKTEEIIGPIRGRRAGRAQPAHQPLGHHRAEAAANRVRLDAHVQQQADDLAGATRVKRGQGHVTGQGGLERDLGRGPIADFADGDDLGILAQQGVQAALESQGPPPG